MSSEFENFFVEFMPNLSDSFFIPTPMVRLGSPQVSHGFYGLNGFTR